MQKIWTPSLLMTLPESILNDPKLRASAEALDFELHKLSTATREVLHLPRLDELSGEILDYLAEQLHVDFYEPLYLNETEKKDLIRTSIAWHRIKGTRAAVEQIAASAFKEAAIEEWQEYDGEPYHFRITSHGYKFTPDGLKTFLRMIRAAKNVRSWLDKIIIDYSPTEPLEIFAGLVETAIGMRTISLPKPKNLKQSVRAGIILTENGLRGGYDWAFPNILIGNRNRACVGQFLLRGGEVTINADLRDLPTYADLIESPIADLLIADLGIVRGGEFEVDVETLEKFYRSNIFSGAALNLTGEREVGLTKPKNAAQKFFIGDALGRFGTIKIAPSTERRLTKKIVVRAGQTLYRAGNIFVESQTRPTIPEGKRFFGRVENVTNYVATALGKLGYEEIKPGSQRWQALHKTVMRVGAAMIRAGEITVDCADESFFDDDLTGDWLKLIFASATSTRALTLPNPRDDLAKSDIRQFGDATVADEILLTRDGQIVTALIRAALIKKSVKVLF